MEQTVLQTIPKHMKDKKVIGKSQHGFVNWKSGLTKLQAFYKKTMGLVDEEGVDVVYSEFSYAFSTVSHSNVVDRAIYDGLGKCSVTRTVQGCIFLAAAFLPGLWDVGVLKASLASKD